MRFVHLLLIGLTSAMLGSACGVEGVGDPFVPEVIPEGGYDPTEVYIVTSAATCQTRVGLVLDLRGLPFAQGSAECDSFIAENDGFNPEDCNPEEVIRERVHCTVRCKAPPGVSASTFDCPGSFRCVELLETGPRGIAGSYCVTREVADALEPDQ